MSKTAIEWTDFSINPIRARDLSTGAVGHYCEKISSGCANCYASALQKRFNMPAFKGRKHADTSTMEVQPFLDESKLAEVLRRRKPTKYFWCDMSDLFGEWVPDEWIDKCFATMALAPQHTHQILTKRPERMAEYLADIPVRTLAIIDAMATFVGRDAPYRGLGLTTHFNDTENIVPSVNIWLGTSVENQQAADERIPHLLRCPAAVRFLSCEPLLGQINLEIPWEGEPTLPTVQVDWVIVGGESGQNARPMHPAWARSIRDQCQAAGVAFFMKQWGEWAPGDQSADQRVALLRLDWNGLVEGKTVMHIGDDRESVFRVGKKAAGRMLDGREWSEFPLTTTCSR